MPVTLHVGAGAVPFELPATMGEKMTLEGLRGRPFLLSFFSMAFTPT